MSTPSEWLSRTKNAAYLKWIVFAEFAVKTLIFLTIASSFFAAANTVQSLQTGVPVFIGILLYFVWTLFRAFEKYRDIRPPTYTDEKFKKLRNLALLSVVCIPIVISWSMNESLYGALNPLGYWKGEFATRTESNCSTFQDMLTQSAENFRVTENKYRMGIATVFEVQGSAETLKLISNMHRDCISAGEKRRIDISKRLKELTGN